MDIASAVTDLDRRLRAQGSPDRAENERRYLKSDLDFYGVGVPAIRRTVGSWQADLGTLTRADLVATVESLWSRPVHELRSAAVRLLETRASLLEPRDMDLIERLIRQSNTWALVDNLAASVAGPLLDRHPTADAVLDRWASDDDFWIRRSALLAHLIPLRSGEGDFERFARYADAMLEEKEFFIRKAIGWVLRDTARKRPQLVYEWILPRAARASGVTIREVVKRLPPDQAASIREARSG
ncbi:MAG TPA: DNA alkylation repair protein [Acidimicrobiia bacterium]|nr:DNA alkylation repair protein [Acidimicrobiia bacterium]